MVWLSILSFFGIYGCAVAVIGIGAAGAGALAYFNGRLIKTYESEYHDTIRAGGDTLERLNIPVTEIIADELKTEINAERPDGTPVAIEVIRMDPEHTQVSVRTGSLGVWDRRVSEQIHVFINETLSQKIADEQKSAEGVAPEAVQPGILEEDLAEDSTPASAQVASSSEQMLPASAFVIFFEQNSNALSAAAVQKLNRISEILINNPAAELELNGYSDSIGAPSYNLMISEIRVNAVKSYLIDKGIQPSRILAMGHGAQKFIASNKSAAGRRLNRRVEIELIHP